MIKKTGQQKIKRKFLSSCIKCDTRYTGLEKGWYILRNQPEFAIGSIDKPLAPVNFHNFVQNGKRYCVFERS